MTRPIKTGLVVLAAILCGLFVTTLLAWLLGVDPLTPGNWTGQAASTIKPWRTGLMVVRWAVWCLLWWRWDWAGERLFWGDSPQSAVQRVQWGPMRHRMLGGIALVEALTLFSKLTGG